MKLAVTATLLSAVLTLGPGLVAGAQAPPVASAAPAPAPLVLRYKFTPGQVLRYRMTMDMTYAMPGKSWPDTSAGGGPKAMQMHSESVTRQTVKSVRATDGAATLTSFIESMTTTANGQTHQSTPAELAKINQGNVVVMTPAGQVESSKVGLFSSGAVPGLDGSKGFMTSTGGLPGGPVRVGDTWDGTGASGVVGMQMKLSSTLTGVDAAPAGPVADIGQTYAGTFDLKIGGPQTPMRMTGVASGTGQMRFDTGAGAVADSTSTINEDMTTALPASLLKSAPAGTPKTLQMKITIAMKMERLPDAP